MPYKDKEKQKEAALRFAHTEKGIAHRKKQRDARVELVRQLKTGPCYHCGKTYDPCCMDLHHVNPLEKSFTINANGKGIAALQEEAKKCIRLCAICHRMHHNGLIQLNLEEWQSGLMHLS